jgi:CubicO group peptidase (beta-lactamase class C family)
VAQASGRPYAEFLTERVLVPLDLTETSVGGFTPAARGYRDGRPVTSWPLGTMPGTGDICATVGDVARFEAAVYSGSLISQSSLQAMITPHAPIPEDQGTSDGWVTADGYGYGQYIFRVGGHAAYGHTGDNPGYRSLAAWLPAHAACVAFLSNEETADTEALLRQLVPVALDAGVASS